MIARIPIIAVTTLMFMAITLVLFIGGCNEKDKEAVKMVKSNTSMGQFGALPGIAEFDSDLINLFVEILKQRGSDYTPRTRHLLTDGWARYTNRLFLESSPYLLQHAHNPVNWYPWGDEAFETAKKLDCPVLLSIGYSTCHWCHVMEEESFEDEEIAEFLNRNYIAVKVDREERPDLDSIYMNAVQAITGHGGWPMTVFLTQGRKPFYGGTYFPARDGDRGASVGFLTILQKIKGLYETQRDVVDGSSLQIAEMLHKTLIPEPGVDLPEEDHLNRIIDVYRKNFDKDYGGIGAAPKFPSSMSVRLLFRQYHRKSDKDALNMAKLTLDRMADGGIYDHVGGGFHRYSTDQQWLVPHFEKMLYDNALLIMSYLDGYQVTHDEDYKRIVVETLKYVQRDMTAPEGAFYSATDADSLTPDGDREEGYFFTWTATELEEILSKETAEIFRIYYNIEGRPNFEGRYIPNRINPGMSKAKSQDIVDYELLKIIEESKKILYRARNKRTAPLRDKKILTAWNGLMISAHARAGLVLGDNQYIERAVRAARFVLGHLYIDGRLFRSYSEGKPRHEAYLNDYSFLIAALLDLYEATFDPEWFTIALELETILEENFKDMEHGGFFMTANDHEKLIAREKPYNDGAIPSGNSIAALNLMRLSEFTLDQRYMKKAEKLLVAFSNDLRSNPMALSEMMLAVDFYLDKVKEIIIVTPGLKKDGAEVFLEEIRKHFLPNHVLAVVSEQEVEAVAKIIPIVKGRTTINSATAAYICEQGTCKLPTIEREIFSKQIQ
ncbi:MAG: thioredoxin domain-containing protein [Deltaproteobacteria bacterium]|nr:thioredoxin domain-containing protein [Deltaproteobacteria bacterium]